MKGKKRAARKGGYRKRRTVAKSPANSCKVVEFYDLGQYNTNEAYDFVVSGIVPNINGGTTISRAAQVAEAFGLYRIAQLEYKITPKFDTYSSAVLPTGTAPAEVPKLFWRINRFGDDTVGFNMANMLTMGCKPLRLDDTTLTIKYKPNILLAGAGQADAALFGGSGNIKMTPWLNTGKDTDEAVFALSTQEHVGHQMYIEAASTGTGVAPVCEISLRIVYEFKNPRIINPEAQEKRPHVKTSGNVKTQVLSLEQANTMNAH